jgi:predicted nicotinamide N-methyase
LFGVVWDAGRALAELMANYPVEDLRVLEVGCGIGLASHLLNARSADITATDHHPEAGIFLRANARLNDEPDIPFVRADWSGTTRLGRFDLVIGSDLLYEAGQVELLPGFIDAHANPQCLVLIVDPGRGQCGRMDKRMTSFGYVASRSDASSGDFRGRLLRYDRRVPPQQPSD